MVSFPADTLSAQTITTPQLSPSSPAALTAEEKALIDDIIRELDQARKLTNDKDIQSQIAVIRGWVKKVQTLAASGETEAALEIKYTIAKRLEWLINQLPTVTPGTTSAAAATATTNPLYDELVRIRAKIDKLIELEEREIPTLRPYEPPEIQRPPEMERLIVYSAKFLCGPALGGEGVQPGTYSTAINVHNPHNDTIYLFKKAVIAQREDEPRGRISAFRKVALRPDEAIEIDCIDIVRFFGAQQETGVTAPSQQTQTSLQTAAVPTVTVRTLETPVRFIKGFVVIYATAPLDVVGVYTASTPVGFSLDIEQIPQSTVGVRPILIPEEPEEEVCPQGCVCLNKDDAYKRYGQNVTLCQEEPCDYDERQNPLYCWKPGEQAVCPQGCVCLNEDDAYKRYGPNATICQDAPCGYDQYQNPMLCWKPGEQAVCPQGCYCLTEDEAYGKLGTNATMCQEQPCGYAAAATGAAQIAKYCWKPAEEVQCPQGCFCATEAEAREYGYTWCQNQKIACGKDATTGADRYCFQKPVEQAVCPQECVCLTENDAYNRYGPNVTLCHDQPCGYVTGATAAMQVAKYCWKPATQETQCPTGCVCLTEAQGNEPGYAWCQNQRMQCGQDPTGALKYCYQKGVPMVEPVQPKPGRILIDPTQASNPVGSQHTITVVVYDTNGKPMANVRVKISHTGANSYPPIELTTDGNGKASYSYTGKNTGTDTIVATVDSLSAKATKEWSSIRLQTPPILK